MLMQDDPAGTGYFVLSKGIPVTGECVNPIFIDIWLHLKCFLKWSFCIGTYAHFIFLFPNVIFISFNAKKRLLHACERWDKALGSYLKCVLEHLSEWLYLRM